MKVWIHIKGNVAEYTASERGTSGQYYDLTARLSGDDVWFSNKEYCENGMEFPNWYETKNEALEAAMDYHESEGCKAYLELYPAPDKGGWNYIAQNASGKWYGYDYKPNPSISSWFAEEGEEFPMIQSPPNPFWRKTLR